MSAANNANHAVGQLVGRLLLRLVDLLQSHWKVIVVGIPFLWLLLFFLAPFIIVIKISLAESLIASPPYSPLYERAEDGVLSIRVIFENYSYLWEDDLYLNSYINSVKIASVSTVFCLLIGYPMAYGIARSNPTTKNILLMLVILPFWTSFLLRVYAWMSLLADQGTINSLLIWLGVIDEPIRMLYSELAVYIGIVYSYLPFMILPLYANMEKLDVALDEAAADLGAKPTIAFLTVTLPLTLPGIIAGSLLVFIPATGEFVSGRSDTSSFDRSRRRHCHHRSGSWPQCCCCSLYAQHSGPCWDGNVGDRRWERCR